MFYKGIILDLDNTIYDYDVCHNKALSSIFNYLILTYPHLKTEGLITLYKDISIQLKVELVNTASSHNKSIYFKQLIETLNLDMYVFSTINHMYWDIFYENITCFEGVLDFLVFNRTIGKRIGILTDYETEYQLIKLEKLGVLKYIDVIVTSEEVGKEKPSAQMFNTVLKKMKMTESEVIMIGDNFEKDISGAANRSIFSYWFNRSKSYAFCENYITFNSFLLLHSKFKEIYKELLYLKKISKYCGERFDLVQAGGGNSSLKIEEFMFIKSSGYSLANVDENNGYTTMNQTTLLQDIYKDSVKDILTYNIIGDRRGSIETFMHSILKKYTMHLHPIQVNRILVSKNATKIINEIYPESLIIKYFTPGINLCNQIKEKYEGQQVIFLLNHGIIITSDTLTEIYSLLDGILEKFESYQNIDFLKYKNTNKISNTINHLFNVDNFTYFCEDALINVYLSKSVELFKRSITFPDCLIYCGVRVLLDIGDIEDYKKKYNEPPKLIIDKQNIYINSHSIAKCKEIEDVLKSNLIILDSDVEQNYLSHDEICFLNNWDAEKYRKLL